MNLGYYKKKKRQYTVNLFGNFKVGGVEIGSRWGKFPLTPSTPKYTNEWGM